MNEQEKTPVAENELQTVKTKNERFVIENKKDIICVLPYTLDEGGLLDTIGILEVKEPDEKISINTILKGLLSSDDGTNLVGANRILYEVTGMNFDDASRWMYLGRLFVSLYSDSPLYLYAVDVSNIKMEENVENEEKRKLFKFINASEVAQSDDMIFLSSFLRLFNFFYTKAMD